MNFQEAAETINDICMTVYDELVRTGEQHSCIFGGAALGEVFKRIGYTSAYPLTVRAVIFNPPFSAKIKASGLPADPAAVAACESEGCSRVLLGIGAPAPDS